VLFVHQEEEKRFMAKTFKVEKINWYINEQKTCTEALFLVKEERKLICPTILGLTQITLNLKLLCISMS